MTGEHPTIRFFGSPSIGSGERARALSGSTADVFAYLVANSGRDVRRERLADLFWSESEPVRARGALNTVVWRINKILAGIEGLSLRSGNDLLTLEACPEAHIDAKALETAVRDAAGVGLADASDILSSPGRAALARAVDDYHGPFLEGSTSEWAEMERERLAPLLIRGLGLLMRDSAQRRDYEEALGYGRRILAADPFREQVQCEMMWLYVLNGQRPQALRHFESYRRMIAHEINVGPMAETRALVEYIRDDRDEPVEPSAFRGLARASDPLALLRDTAERSRLNAYRTFSAAAPGPEAFG